MSQFDSYTPTWCSGCGNWPMRVSLIKALEELGKAPHDIFMSFDIGCNGNMNDFIKAYAVHGLHGRSIPMAIGMKLGNHEKTVISIGGDGATYGEGGNHFLHACRGNHDITVIVHDNSIYGLTTGQTSPATPEGMKTKSTPLGAPDKPVNPLSLAITQGATFVAQSFSADGEHLKSIIKKAIEHRGFSLVNVLQPCVTFNKINTYHYYMNNSTKLRDDRDASNFEEGLKLALDAEKERFNLGVLYEVQKLTFLDHFPQVKEPLVTKARLNSIDTLLARF